MSPPLGLLHSWIVIVALVLFAPGQAHSSGAATPTTAEESSANSVDLPYAAWRGEALAPPATQPPRPQPQPVVGRPEHPRRPFELVLQAGTLLAACRAGTESIQHCRDVKPFVHGGLLALWRVHPYFSWGGGFDRASLRLVPPGRHGGTVPQARLLFAGLAGRVHARDEGALDPYLQLDLGYELVRESSADGAGSEIVEVTAGPALRIGAGLDCFVLPRLRFGPAITLVQGVVGQARRCPVAGDCVNLDPGGHVSTAVAWSARVTLSVGHPH